MKKALLFALLAVSITAAAQSTYEISRPLRLKTVPLSETKSDSVMVVTSSGDVRLSPRSEFSSGGGGSQDLNSVLTNGNQITGNNFIDILNDDGSGSTYYGILRYDRVGATYQINDGTNLYTGYNLDVLDGLRLQRSIVEETGHDQTVGLNWEDGLYFSDASTGGAIKLRGGSPTELRDLELPDKSGTLATTDEINLQNVLMPNGVPAGIATLTDGSPYTGTVELTSYLMQLHQEGVYGATTFSMGNGTFNLRKRSDLGETPKYTNLNFNEPQGGLFDNAGVNIPAPLSGSHTLLLSINGEYADEAGNIEISVGGSQGIDSVLATGNEAIDKNLTVKTADALSTTNVSAGYFFVGNNQIPESIENRFVLITEGKVSFKESGSDLYANLSSELITDSDKDLLLPNKNGTLAITEDITLQKALEGGGIAYLSSDDTINLTQISNDGSVSTVSHQVAALNGRGSAQLSISASTAGSGAELKSGFQDELGTIVSSGSVNIPDGQLTLTQTSLSGETRLVFETPTVGLVNIKVPAKSIAGDYTLTTTTDLTTSNLIANIGVDVPSTATSTGTAGQVRVDVNYIYVCTATNTWARSPLTTW